MKKFVLLLAMMLITAPAFAAGKYASVDVDKILNGYSKTKTLNANFQKQEADIRVYMLDAQKKVVSAKTDAERKALEDKYGKELQTKMETIQKAKLEALKNACIEAHGDRVKLLHILIERKLSKTKCEKILRELEPSNDGSRKVIKRKRTKSVEQSLFDAMNELQAENNRAESFDYDHIEGISHSIRSAFPNCWNIINCLKGDLEWVLNPKYCKCQTVEERIDVFCKHLEKGKTKSQSEKGTDMSWKNNVYKDVDIKAVHDFLIDKYCK